MAPKRPLGPEERQLWERIAEQTKPLEKKHVPAERLNGYRMLEGRIGRRDPLDRDELMGHAAWIPAAEGRGLPVEDFSAPEPKRKRPDLAAGRLHDLDRRNAEKLAAGKRRIDRRLDLHGLTQAQAEAALDRAIAESAARGHRVLLVITGKGGGSAVKRGLPDEGGQGTGILKHRLPEWLNRPRNRERVVAFTPAQPRDGGAGAFYVLLRRRREG